MAEVRDQSPQLSLQSGFSSPTSPPAHANMVLDELEQFEKGCNQDLPDSNGSELSFEDKSKVGSPKDQCISPTSSAVSGRSILKKQTVNFQPNEIEQLD